MFKTAEVNGKKIAYTDDTKFYIQVGRGYKGHYETRYCIQGNIGQAFMHYNCINIGNGYKKRLYVPSFNKPTLAREVS